MGTCTSSQVSCDWLAHNITLAKSVAHSVLHHVLSSVSPTPELASLWRDVEQSLLAGPKTWLGLAAYRWRQVFEWPTSLPNLQVSPADLSLKQLSCLRFDVDAWQRRIEQAHLMPTALLIDLACSWFGGGGGAISTWNRARAIGRELDLTKRQRVVGTGSHRIALRFALLLSLPKSVPTFFLRCLQLNMTCLHVL